MKRILLTIGIFTLVCFISTISAQSDKCSDLRQEYDRTDNKVQRLENLRIANEDFFSLMDNPQSTDGGIPEEIANYEHRIDRLKRKITAGDTDPNLVQDIKTFQARIVLLNERSKRNFNKVTMAKDPRFLEQQKGAKYVSSDQLELKLELARLGEQLKSNNCPAITNNNIDDLMIEDKNDGKDKPIVDKPKNPGGDISNFSGNWIYTDPGNPELPIVFSVAGSGSATTGTMTFGEAEMPAKYTISGCIESGDKRLRCEYTSIMEDYQKYVDGKGSVELMLSEVYLITTWKDYAPPTVRWKKGFESTIKRVGDARTLPISFTRK